MFQMQRNFFLKITIATTRLMSITTLVIHPIKMFFIPDVPVDTLTDSKVATSGRLNKLAPNDVIACILT